MLGIKSPRSQGTSETSDCHLLSFKNITVNITHDDDDDDDYPPQP